LDHNLRNVGRPDFGSNFRNYGSLALGTGVAESYGVLLVSSPGI
jgi:hypothetical protein